MDNLTKELSATDVRNSEDNIIHWNNIQAQIKIQEMINELANVYKKIENNLNDIK